MAVLLASNEVKNFRIPQGGILGLGSQFAGMTFDDIDKQDEEWGDDEGTDMLCEIYRRCQMYRRAPGSPEATFIRAFEASTEDCYA